MLTFEVKIEGLEKLQTAFRRSPEICKRYLNRAIQKSIFSIERETKKVITTGSLRAIDTGRLRASIGGGKFRGGEYAKGHGIKFREFYGEVGTNVKYSPYIHEGTYKMRARPFLREGAKEANSTIEKWFKQAGDNILKDLVK